MTAIPDDPLLCDLVVSLAWRDDISFDEIKDRTGLPEKQVIAIMRRQLKAASFKRWRKRVTGRKAKHRKRSRADEKEGLLEMRSYW